MTEHYAGDETVVPLRAFHDAVACGDLATVAAFFRQPTVRDAVRQANEFIAANGPNHHIFTLPDGSYPWYCDVGGYMHSVVKIPLIDAIDSGHDRVLDWFFSLEHGAELAVTLWMLVPAIVARGVDASRRAYVLEQVVATPLFTEFPDDMQQWALDAVVWGTHDSALAQQAIAHGASVNNTIAAVAMLERPSLIDDLAQAGAFLVGDAKALYTAVHSNSVAVAKRLLEYGVDWGNEDGLPLRMAVSQVSACDFVYLLVRDGFADVDAREEDGGTALMHAVGTFGELDGLTDVELFAFVEPLLEAGADIHFTDPDGVCAAEVAEIYGRYEIAEIIQTFG